MKSENNNDGAHGDTPDLSESEGDQPPQKSGHIRQENQVAALEQRIGRGEKWMITFTGAAALFTLCSAVVALLQWRVMSGQLNEMKNGSVDTHELAVAAKSQSENTKSMAEAAKSQASAAIDQVAKLDAGVKETHALAIATQNSLTLARQNFIEDQRPWVFTNNILPEPFTPRDKDGRFSAGEKMYWRIYVSNYGRSPAFMRAASVRLFCGPNAMRDAEKYLEQFRQTASP